MSDGEHEDYVDSLLDEISELKEKIQRVEEVIKDYERDTQRLHFGYFIVENFKNALGK